MICSIPGKVCSTTSFVFSVVVWDNFFCKRSCILPVLRCFHGFVASLSLLLLFFLLGLLLRVLLLSCQNVKYRGPMNGPVTDFHSRVLVTLHSLQYWYEGCNKPSLHISFTKGLHPLPYLTAKNLFIATSCQAPCSAKVVGGGFAR